jgi:hypothetical protein
MSVIAMSELKWMRYNIQVDFTMNQLTLNNDVVRVLNQETNTLETSVGTLAKKCLLTGDLEAVLIRSTSVVPGSRAGRGVGLLTLTPVSSRVNRNLRCGTIAASPGLANLASRSSIYKMIRFRVTEVIA